MGRYATVTVGKADITFQFNDTKHLFEKLGNPSIGWKNDGASTLILTPSEGREVAVLGEDDVPEAGDLMLTVHRRDDAVEPLLNSIPTDLEATARTAAAAVKLLRKRRVELVEKFGELEGGQRQQKIFETGWHCVPDAVPLSGHDTRRWVKTEEGVTCVYLMGREDFTVVKGEVQKLKEGKLPGGVKTLLVYGPKGTGKTHLLLALALHLTEEFDHERTGLRPCPIFDCEALVDEDGRVEAYQHGLAWGFWNDPENLKKIARLKTMADVKAFIRLHPNLLWLLDQVQALDKAETKQAKQQLQAFLQNSCKVFTTSGGSAELVKLLESGHANAMPLLIMGLSQKDQVVYNRIYGTDCSTPLVLQRLEEELEGNAGAMADFHITYYGASSEERLEKVCRGRKGFFLEEEESGETDRVPSGTELSLSGMCQELGRTDRARGGMDDPLSGMGQEQSGWEVPMSGTDLVGGGTGLSGGGMGLEGLLGSGTDLDASRVFEHQSEAHPPVAESETVGNSDQKRRGRKFAPLAVDESGTIPGEAGCVGKKQRLDAVKESPSVVPTRVAATVADEEPSSEADKDWAVWRAFTGSESMQLVELGIRRSCDRAQGPVKRMWVALMKTMVFSSTWVALPHIELSLLEPKFFAIRGARGVGFAPFPRCIKPAYPFVRRLLAALLETMEDDLVFFNDQDSWTSITKEIQGPMVPTVVGLLAERCALGVIGREGGYKTVFNVQNEIPVRVRIFPIEGEADVAIRAKADLADSVQSQLLVVAIPASEAYRASDAVCSLWTKTDQPPYAKLRLVVLQSTLMKAADHLHSTAKAMHPDTIKPWLAGTALDEVVAEMCYLVPKERITGPTTQLQEDKVEIVRALRKNSRVVQVAHKHVELAFGALDPRFDIVDSWPSALAAKEGRVRTG